MRYHEIQSLPTLAGSLLVAHPSLSDPNFRRSVILISAHSEADGAVGVVVNRPLNQTLGELKTDFIGTCLSKVPVYYGGPVGSSEVILTAWKCTEGRDLVLYFGVSPEKAEELISDDPALDIRGFLGYSGWGEGQLEGELKENAWMLSPLVCPLLKRSEEHSLWKQIVRHMNPQLGFLAEAPEDPSLN